MSDLYRGSVPQHPVDYATMSQPMTPVRRYTVLEYLEFENAADPRHEYFDGQIVAMSGGTFKHTTIGSNIPIVAAAALKGSPCRPFNSDLRIFVRSTNSVFYPDATIICGQPEFDAALPHGEAVTNPTVIFEVLSPSTEKMDRTRKFSAYMRLPSFREYVLVYADQPRIESFLRQDDGTWSFSFVEGMEAALRLRSLNVSLPMADLFASVNFDPLSPEPTLDAK